MLNPHDVFDDVSVSAIKHPEVEKRMEAATQALITNMENDLEGIMLKLGVSTEEELFDNLGSYIVSESTKVIHAICKELTAEDKAPYKLKLSFSGADYLRMTYDRSGFDPSVGKYQDVVLKGLMAIKTFPKVVDLELTCSIKDTTLVSGEVRVVNADAVKPTIYNAFGPVFDRIVDDMRVVFKDTPDAARDHVVNGMMDGIRKSLLDNPNMLLDTPARLYQSYLKYATNIQWMNTSGEYEPISKTELSAQILSKLEKKTPTINDVLGGIEFN